MKRQVLLYIFVVPAILFIHALGCAADRVYTVAGHSMSPVLLPGDRVIVSETVDGPLHRGKLVAIRLKHRPAPMVKRVVAVEGDKVTVEGNSLFVNGKKTRPIDEKRWQPTIRQLERYGWTIPANSVFVLGDNPENSRDSRRLGLLSVNQITGKVLQILKADK